ncbi:hypothetical protein OHA72_26710 [Dactylosporangium sp. NBC_01737]|uniref:hypothetical protein n=1 Tax=Dactylosporangium sp. NBC_01737 TaxID=2975959 RepID=UPI002E0E7D56|nr:hypothetical protein OHA72_26710 [Dactylosporangium sp. NBC_01737]
MFAAYGWNRWGFWPYTVLSLLATVAVAALSWHLVERHALRGKDWTPARRSHPV